MVTENVNVRFRQTGGRTIARTIDRIGVAANAATRSIFLFQRALFVIGGAHLLRGLANYADALTLIENRLRLTTSTTKELEQVQDGLVEASRRARSDLQGTADVYSRIALSVRRLGAGSEAVLRVTESLQKAAIISGASAREATAALIQLGQGLASNRLSGDELRAVLEQLPFVADVIAEYLTETGRFGEVSRGELRQLGREGKLTTRILFEAFEASTDKINELFAQTQATIGQAFNVARTNLLAFIDSLDDATGISGAVANAIIRISESLDIITTALGLTALGFAATFTSRIISRIAEFGGRLSRLRNIQAELATRTLNSRNAIIGDTKARIANVAAAQARSAAILASARAEFMETQFVVRNGRVRSLQTGRFIEASGARDRLTAATLRLNQAERVNLGLTNQLTLARGANAAAENAAAASASRVTAARAAQSGALVRLSAQFPIVAAGFRLVHVAAAGLWALMVAHPLLAIIGGVSLLIVGFAKLTERIKVGTSGLVSIRDVAVEVFRAIARGLGTAFNAVVEIAAELAAPFAPAVEAIKEALNSVAATVFSVLGDVLNIFKNIINFIIGLWVAAFKTIRAIWNNFPAYVELVLKTVFNNAVQGIEDFVNVIISGINILIDALNRIPGVAIQALESVSLQDKKLELTDDARELSEEIARIFREELGRDFLGNLGESIAGVLTRAYARALSSRIRSPTDFQYAPPPPPEDEAKGPTFESEIAQLRQRLAITREYGLARSQLTNVYNVERALKRELIDTEREEIEAVTASIEKAMIRSQILEDAFGPQREYNLGLQAANELLEQGTINADQYAAAVDKMKQSLEGAATAQKTFASTLQDAIIPAEEIGAAIGERLVNFTNTAANAFVELATKGKTSIKDLFRTLFAQLLQLAAQQLLLRLLTSFLGIPIIGFQSGGSILPSGPGSTDTQIVTFAKRPDERVDVLTPEQQAAQRRGFESSPVVMNTNNVAVVLSEEDIRNALDNDEGDAFVVRAVSRNASSVRSAIGYERS